jgi:hypothetical protein
MPETKNRWSALAGLSDGHAQEAMVARFHAVAAGPADQRFPELRTMIVEEYELDAEALHRFTANRLRSWLTLPAVEANIIASAYNAVFESLPSEVAMRRASTVQTVARTMTASEVDGLHALIPSLLGPIPSGRPAASAPADSAASRPKKGWRFWKR